jgi:Flp pilus assembly protein TadD
VLLGAITLSGGSFFGWRAWPAIQFSAAVKHSEWFKDNGGGAVQIYQRVRDQRGQAAANEMAQSARPQMQSLSDNLFDRYYRESSIQPFTWSQVAALESLLVALAPGDDTKAREAFAIGENAVMGRHSTEALTSFQRASALKPGWALAQNGLGMACVLANDLQGAEQFYKEASRLDPGWIFPSQNLGGLYAKEGRLADAVQQYRATIRINPKWPGTWYLLAQVDSQLRRYADACQAYRKAAEFAGSRSPGSFDPAYVQRRIRQVCR